MVIGHVALLKKSDFIYIAEIHTWTEKCKALTKQANRLWKNKEPPRRKQRDFYKV
jgi:hypothetical protein